MGHADHFNDAVNLMDSLKASDPKKYWSVSHPSEGSEVKPVGDKGYISMKTGPSWHPHNEGQEVLEVGGLVAKPGAKGTAKDGLNIADQAHSTHPQVADCFDGHLPELYKRFGFKETSRMPFDAQYAPAEWDEKTHGRPDVVLMERPAAQGSLFPKEYPTTPDVNTKAPAPINATQFSNADQGNLF